MVASIQTIKKLYQKEEYRYLFLRVFLISFLTWLFIKIPEIVRWKAPTLSPLELIISILFGIILEIEPKRYNAEKSLIKTIAKLENLSNWIEAMPHVKSRKMLTNHSLKHLEEILRYSNGDKKYESFWANIYLMRSMTPARILPNPSEDSFLILLRGVEEARAIPGASAPKNIRDHFERIQEEDYKQLFHMVNKFYYVTSYGDHDVWVISKRADLKFYRDNYRRDKELKDSDKNEENSVPESEEYKKRFGIHRAFVLPLISVNDSDAQCFIKGFKHFFKTKYGEYDVSQLKGWGITNDNFKNSPKVQFLSVLLAAKIHETLGIDFGVVPIDKDIQNVERSMKDKLEALCILPSEKGCLEEWKLGWKRLGSALFDDVIYAYAERTSPKEVWCPHCKSPSEITCPHCNESFAEKTSTVENAIVYYRFEKDGSDTFAEDIVSLILENNKFSKFNDNAEILQILETLESSAKDFVKIIQDEKTSL